MRNVECHSCGEIGHVRAVCKKKGQGATRGGEVRKDSSGVAFTAWREDARASTGVWLVDSGTTQHLTPDRRQFASYRELARVETIEGIGGESLKVVGIREVELECRMADGARQGDLEGGSARPRGQGKACLP